MEMGSNKSLYTLIAVVVFGIFLSLSYWLFQDEFKGVLATTLFGTSLSIDKKVSILEDYVMNGYLVYTNSITVISKGLQDITYTCTGGTYWGEGLYFEAKHLEVNKKYVLAFDMVKTSGDIFRIGGHNVLGDDLDIYIDGVKIESANSSTVPYPNDNLTHHIEFHFNTKYLVKDGTNVYVSNTTETYPYYYIQPNRGVTNGPAYGIKITGLSVLEVN